jgi:hypothetical protein
MRTWSDRRVPTPVRPAASNARRSAACAATLSRATVRLQPSYVRCAPRFAIGARRSAAPIRWRHVKNAPRTAVDARRPVGRSRREGTVCSLAASAGEHTGELDRGRVFGKARSLQEASSRPPVAEHRVLVPATDVWLGSCARAAPVRGLYGRTRYRAVRTKDAAITGQWVQHRAAPLAVVEVLACVRWHHFFLAMPA